jgi:hypothetical protein
MAAQTEAACRDIAQPTSRRVIISPWKSTLDRTLVATRKRRLPRSELRPLTLSCQEDVSLRGTAQLSLWLLSIFDDLNCLGRRNDAGKPRLKIH